PLGFELGASGARQRVELRTAAILRRAPFRLNPSLVLHPVQRGIKRPLLHLQCFARDLLDALRDGPAMQRLEREYAENQQVERALYEVGRLHPLIIYRNAVDNQGGSFVGLLARARVTPLSACAGARTCTQIRGPNGSTPAPPGPSPLSAAGAARTHL